MCVDRGPFVDNWQASQSQVGVECAGEEEKRKKIDDHTHGSDFNFLITRYSTPLTFRAYADSPNAGRWIRRQLFLFTTFPVRLAVRRVAGCTFQLPNLRGDPNPRTSSKYPKFRDARLWPFLSRGSCIAVNCMSCRAVYGRQAVQESIILAACGYMQVISRLPNARTLIFRLNHIFPRYFYIYCKLYTPNPVALSRRKN